MTKYHFIILFTLANLMAHATDPKIDSLKKLGRTALIELAVKKINNPAFDPQQYDRIIVKANKESLIVSFGLSVVVKSKQICYYDAVWVALAGEEMSGGSIQGVCAETPYFTRTKELQEKIDAVFEAINKSTEVGHVPDKRLPDGTSMEITEHDSYYYVETSSWSTYSHFKVDKNTGKISEAGHKHYARDPDEEERWEIID
ncbi:MAG TPA: hypothetical protein VGD65_10115 [Chryseosolibacter sp.]